MSKLWDWFSLSYASWLTLPRVLMHEMPEEWQNRMTQLLNEYNEAFPCSSIKYGTRVQLTIGNKLVKTPNWLINYRHPNHKKIEEMKT